MQDATLGCLGIYALLLLICGKDDAFSCHCKLCIGDTVKQDNNPYNAYELELWDCSCLKDSKSTFVHALLLKFNPPIYCT